MAYAYDRQPFGAGGSWPGRDWFGAPEDVSVATSGRPFTWVDGMLVCVFLIGMYTNFTIAVTAKVPFPSVPSGVAGILMLWRRRDQITQTALVGLLVLLTLYLGSVLSASGIGNLSRRTNGLL